MARRSSHSSNPNGQTLEAAVGDELEALDGAGHLERLDPLEQMAVHDLDLDAGEVGAHAEVLAEPEGQMRVRTAVDTKGGGILEHVLVSVRRGEVDRNLLPRRDLHSVHLDVRGGNAREVADRAYPAQHLLHGI